MTAAAGGLLALRQGPGAPGGGGSRAPVASGEVAAGTQPAGAAAAWGGRSAGPPPTCSPSTVPPCASPSATPLPAAPASREAGRAVWRQIADVLEEEVGRGVHAPGARLPSEAQLATRFAVNRHTARRAVEELVRAGLATMERGRGAFVPEDVLDYAVGHRPRFSEWMRAQNREPSGRVLALGEVAADAALAAALAIGPGEPVVRFERLGLADGRPVSLATHHFPAARLPGLLEALAGAPTITEALGRAGVADFRRQSTRVTARMPTPEEATLLGVSRARPLLVTETLNVDAHGTVVEVGAARYPSSRVQLVFEP